MPRPERLVLAGVLAFVGAAAAEEAETKALYAAHCAACHGADRLGGTGPALLPSNLGRLKPGQAREIVEKGREATQMPGFAGLLSEAEIERLVAFVYREPETPPRWTTAEIEASRRFFLDPARLPDEPVHDADPLNLFVLVEQGDHHASVIDGDRLRRIARFPTHLAVHGGPKFSPDGRFVHFLSRDGWILRYDLWSLARVGEVRAGINARNIAISADGRVLAVANYLPPTLVLLEAERLRPLAVIEIRDRTGTRSSRISAVYAAPPRDAFVVALKDVAEIWEIDWRFASPSVSDGPEHGREKGAASASAPERSFVSRRIEGLPEPVEDFVFDPSWRYVVGSSRDGTKLRVVDLDLGRVIAEIPSAGLPHLAAGIGWERRGRRLLAFPNLREASLTVLDTASWEVVKRIETSGPGFFLRSHENSPYAWLDASLGGKRDTVQVVDKERLEIVKTLTPMPGAVAAHTEFDRHGRYVLLSVGGRDGAVVVYDARTLEEVARIPADKPSGKYNVGNKIRRSEGTSP
ncbi:MAG: c-type cytochrome [Geminicoccaceae bacterium]|nr:c-type cytochrome [Geminicoccaceae bacterium]